jgi:hypothetical protein
VVTANEPPEFEPPRRPDLPNDAGPEPPRTNLAMIALIAFVFGVFLHGCVALSILDDGSSSGSSGSREQPSVEPAVTVAANATATRLPDRTTCAEIQGTDYRSTAERDFFRANCIATATPTPSASPSPSLGPSPTATRRPG